MPYACAGPGLVRHFVCMYYFNDNGDMIYQEGIRMIFLIKAACWLISYLLRFFDVTIHTLVLSAVYVHVYRTAKENGMAVRHVVRSIEACKCYPRIR